LSIVELLMLLLYGSFKVLHFLRNCSLGFRRCRVNSTHRVGELSIERSVRMKLFGELFSRDQRRVLEEHLPIHPFAPSFAGINDEVLFKPGMIFFVLLCVEVFHVRFGATLLKVDEEKVDVEAFGTA